MTAPLYNPRILRLAASIPHHHRLPDAMASVDLRAPICGSTLALDLDLDGDGRVSALGLQVRACALGQASASLMAAHAIGHSADSLAAARDALAAWLTGTREAPPDWPDIDALAPALPYSARHPAIRLAFDAVAQAAAQASHELNP